ncbi:MAG: hypothetical protein AAGB32_00820 [Pseudomonadota bacterium]
MDSRETLATAIDHVFEHLGVDAVFSREGAFSISLTVLKSAADTEYEFSDGTLVGNIAKFEMRISDIEDAGRPLPNDLITVDDVKYKIYAEPLRNMERGTWDVEGLLQK